MAGAILQDVAENLHLEDRIHQQALAHAFFIPIAVALLFNILCRPVVRWLERRRVGAPIGATIVVVVALTACSWRVGPSAPREDLDPQGAREHERGA